MQNNTYTHTDESRYRIFFCHFDYAFVQEIQDALDEQQNNFDSLINCHQQKNKTLTEPFAFESQIDTDTYPVDLSLKSTDDSNEQTLNQTNESLPILGAPDEKERTWIVEKNMSNIKKEAVTPVIFFFLFVIAKQVLVFLLVEIETTSIEDAKHFSR